MKVVVNKCYGGFGLSPLAVKEIAKLKGSLCYFFTYDSGSKKYIEVNLNEAVGSFMWSAYSVPNPNEFNLNSLGKDGTYRTANKKAKIISLRYSELSRDDADLVAVVELLGDKANGNFANIEVIEIPDGIEWEIDEYDGFEQVAEKHRVW